MFILLFFWYKLCKILSRPSCYFGVPPQLQTRPALGRRSSLFSAGQKEEEFVGRTVSQTHGPGLVNILQFFCLVNQGGGREAGASAEDNSPQTSFLQDQNPEELTPVMSCSLAQHGSLRDALTLCLVWLLF